jgi:hypothetical protein
MLRNQRKQISKIERKGGIRMRIVCGKNKQTIKLFNIIRHYNTCHKHMYKNYNNSEKQILLENYKAKINEIRIITHIL